MSPIAGEMRLQSDFELAQDSRTACEWQSFVSAYPLLPFAPPGFSNRIPDNQDKIKTAFAAAFAKMATLGNDRSQMVDCSEVLPRVSTATLPPAHLPAGKTLADVQQAVRTSHLLCPRGVELTIPALVRRHPLPVSLCRPRPGHHCPPCVSALRCKPPATVC